MIREAAALQPIILRTHDLPVKRQVEAWHGWFDSVFDFTRVAPSDAEAFPAESRSWALAGLGISQVSAPRLRVMRTARLLRTDPTDHWSLTLGGTETRLQTPRGATRIPAGQPFLVSLGRELVSEREADTRLQLYIPRDRLGPVAAALDAACDAPLDGPLGALLGDYLRLLASRIPQLTPEEAARCPMPSAP